MSAVSIQKMNWSKTYKSLKAKIPRISVFQLDIVMGVFSYFLAYLLKYSFNIKGHSAEEAIYPVFLFLTFKIIFYLALKTYAGIIRFTSSQDAIRIFYAVTLSTASIFIINKFYFFIEGTRITYDAIILIDFFISIVILTASRLAYKVTYQYINSSSSKERTNVVIFGAGQSAIITKRSLDRDGDTNYKVVAFIDDNPRVVGKTAEGVKVYSSDTDLVTLKEKLGIDELIISVQDISVSRKKSIIEDCISANIKVKNVPPVESWINGELSSKQIKNVKIEDLLERDVIELDKDLLGKDFNGKTILVTGGAGSIGSEIVRQLLHFCCKKILIFDKGETPLFELEQELKNKFDIHNVEFIIGNVCNKKRTEHLFSKFKPDLVFHAAAYKHVPLMENNPAEAICTNVLGTKNIADLAVKYNAEKFVMVSTDKAVNPTNIMGASKRIAEIYTQALDRKLTVNNGTTTHTKFITTRFGNVLGSNGSVIPLFKRQIEEGGPISVTHPEITRYFMTISEACQLVLEAGHMGNGGEIFIFDMGESVKIVDLAKKMIKLSGLQLGKDIQIVFSGLRPGEKLREELLNEAENTKPTHHPKIMIAKVQEYNYVDVQRDIDDLGNLIDEYNLGDLVIKMKQIVPEFISNNSVYSKYDNIETTADVVNN